MEESFGTSNQTVSQSLNIDPNSSEQRRDHNATHSKDNVSISNTASSLHHHHRRKRSHVSPLTRSVHTINLLETASYMECGLPSLRDHVETIELTDEDNGLVGCNPDYLLRNEVSHIGEKSVDALKLTKLDPEFRDLISRYVCSEYVVHCLELAGFCSPYVVAQLDDHQLQRIEAFVGHACSIMKSAALREHFLGPIFANDPLKFKLPSGAACGILLAASEIRRRYRRTQISSDSQNVMDEDVIVVPDSCDQSFNDVACQTDSSVSHSVSLTSPEPVILGETNSVFAGNHDSKSPMPAVSSSSKVSISDSPNSSLKLEATTVSSTESAVMMAAALQVAAAAVSGNGYNSISLFSNPTSNDNNSTFSGLNNSFPADTNSVPHPGTSTSPISSRATVPVANTSAATVAPNAPSSQPSFVPSSSPVSCGSGLYENEVINLERLKQHSSASAIRLASRQFVNAYLMRGRDFDMEMELSVTPEGLKRVTGIFYCHLCREKRERTSAVRFSIARNRYPVLSNVLSHLKTHFHYRGQMLSGLQATVIQQTQNLIKSASALNESFTGQGLGYSPGGFNCPNYRTDIAVESATNPHNASFVQPTISVNQFHSHVKSEPANYTYTVDAEGTEDSNSVHPIYDNLSASPSQRLNSPNNKSSSPRGLGLEVVVPSRPNTSSGNRCNSLTS